MRTLGAYNLSVGTSLALENEASNELGLTESFLVNLRTLVRNVMAAYESKDTITFDQVLKDTRSDLGELARWLDQNAAGRTLSFIVYYPTYKSLASSYPKADLVTPKTRKPKAQEAVGLLERVCDALYKQYPKQIQRTDVSLPKFDGRGLIITHHTVDLTFTPSITRLKLLESYTGVAKPYTKWYTKLTGGNKLYFIPFNRLTIQVFGDNVRLWLSLRELILRKMKSIMC